MKIPQPQTPSNNNQHLDSESEGLMVSLLINYCTPTPQSPPQKSPVNLSSRSRIAARRKWADAGGVEVDSSAFGLWLWALSTRTLQASLGFKGFGSWSSYIRRVWCRFWDHHRYQHGPPELIQQLGNAVNAAVNATQEELHSRCRMQRHVARA